MLYNLTERLLSLAERAWALRRDAGNISGNDQFRSQENITYRSE